MKYLLLIHQGDAPRPRREGETNETAVAAFEQLSDEEKQALYADYGALNAMPGVTPGLELAPPETASTVRVRGGKPIVSDGPFAETKEAVGGYLVLEADGLDAALEVAARVPAARSGGAVEVRPVVER